MAWHMPFAGIWRGRHSCLPRIDVIVDPTQGMDAISPFKLKHPSPHAGFKILERFPKILTMQD